jgi:O-antigen/teichoic acid export membrane protein
MPAMSDSEKPTPRPSLGGQAARGGLVTLVGQLVRVGVQFGSILILARLLTPADFGLVAMVVAIVGVGEVVRDFGLTQAAVQAPTLSREEKDNLFWINTGLGLGLTLIVILSAPLLVALYHEPRLAALAYLISVTFLLNGFSTQFRAQLNRDLKFTALAIVDAGSAAFGLLIAVTMAIAGAGYWALGAQQVVVALSGALMAVIAARWLPGWIHRNTSMASFLKYGGNLMGVQLLTYASKNVDSVIVGASAGSAQLGFYDRAFQILMLPLNQLNAPATKVALPVLSKLQSEKARYDEFILRGQAILVGAISAMLFFVAAQANTLVPLVLGANWAPSAPIFQLLALGGIAQSASYATYWVFLSKGLTASNLRFALVSRPLVIVSIAIGALWGVHGVAAGYSIGLLIVWPFGLWWISRASDAPALLMFFNGARAIVAYGFAGLVSFGASWLARDQGPAFVLLVGVAGFIVAAGLLYVVWPRFRFETKQIWGTAKLLRRR